ncbi:MAG TPA: PAS domain S-box protein, partial [Levilinea sp.]|nr:PAS domain S-box protein [Levilinea sp.]
MDKPSWQILLIDEDEHDYLLTRDMLNQIRRRQVSLDWASSFAGGIELLRQHRYDAVLLDYHLQSHNGIQMIRQFTAEAYPATLILCSGQAVDEVEQQALQAGASTVLSKHEVTPLLLERMIRYAIERKQAEALAAKKVTEAQEFNLHRAEMDAIIDQMNEAVILFDMNRVAWRVNRSAIEALEFDPTGLTPEEITAKVQVSGASGSLLLPNQFLTARAMQGEVIQDETIRLVGVKGKRIIVSASARLFHDAQDRVIGTVLTWHDITGREEHAQALRESEERFRLARRAIEGVVYDWDLIQQTVRQMDGIHDVVGYPAELPIPSNPEWWQNRIHPEDASSARQHLQQALDDQAEGIDCEYRFQHEDGHWVHLWDRAFILRNAAGQPVRVVGLAVDVTERKTAEARAAFLQQLGRDLNLVQQPAEVGALVVQRLGQFLDVDRCFIAEPDLAARTNQVRFDYRRPGFDFKDLGTLSWQPTGISRTLLADHVVVVDDAAVDPLTAGLFQAYLAEVGARAFVLVPLAYRQEDLPLLVALCSKARQWNRQDVQLMQQVARQAWLALERAQVAERLRQSEKRFRIALDQAPICVFSQDRDLRFTWVYNPLRGFPANDILGKSEQELFAPGQVDELLALKREVIELGLPRQRELHVRVGDEWLDIILNAQPVFTPDGQVIGLTGAAMDVSDLRRLQAQQIENEARVKAHHWLMEHREKERMQLARTLHDKPLQDLLAANLYLENVASTLHPDCKENLQQARLMLEKAIGAIRSLALELRPPMLMHLGLEKAIRAYAITFQQRNPGLHVHLSLEQDAQPLNENMRLALYRIFQELLLNVAEHAHASEVWVTLQFKDHALKLTVQDDGCGFEAPEQWVDLAGAGHFGFVGISERLEF